ncbi:hypothetical protein PPERSA_03293 [Pseudocohnilembus persalinus]|uniref:Uncharacterized protein n=1 Tax=Pseudocohnilembus persalinus TaxID=266149 RepID=A0A0V0Q8E1_PSEPJ|nr:hypothetical protein PPERSA_03293 [Pseudocohnilembus persalinus]|eukprot:KRW98462.1 hypothetical protein PPERSA_03293 [Pseudocohnilembus persalinus]
MLAQQRLLSNSETNYNIPLKTNIFNTQVQPAADNRGNLLQVEKKITPLRKQGIWNQPLEKFNKYQSNRETIVRESQFEQINDPKKTKNFTEIQHINDDDYLDTMLFRQVDDYYKNVQNAYEKKDYELLKKYAKEVNKVSTKFGVLDENVVRNLTTVRERVSQTVRQLRASEHEKNRKNEAEIQRLYKTMKEAVSHILSGEGEAKFIRMTEKLQAKEHLNCDNLKERKNLKDPKQALQFQQDLRLLVSKKTDEFEILKQIHGEDFLSDATFVKEMSVSARTGDSGSMISDSVSKYGEDTRNQSMNDPKLTKLYNIKELQHKWGYQNEQQVKNSIRRILVRETLSEAEHKKARQDREEQALRQKMLKNDPGMAYLFKAEDENKKKIWKEVEEKRKKREKEKEERRKKLFQNKIKQQEEGGSDEEEEKLDAFGQKTRLNPQQRKVKAARNKFFNINQNPLLSQGEVFDRTRNYSQAFKDRVTNQVQTLAYKEQPEKIQEYIEQTYKD